MDSIECPILKTLLPPDGDVPGYYDCPPYGNTETADLWVEPPPFRVYVAEPEVVTA